MSDVRLVWSLPNADQVVMLLLAVILIGTFVLIGLGLTIGVLDGRAQRAGWNRLAAGRREQSERRMALDEREHSLAEEARELYEWEGQLIRASECGGCPHCELRRLRGERPAS